MNDAWQHRRGFAFRGALTLGLAVVLAALTPNAQFLLTNR